MRKHIHVENFPVEPQTLFSLLITPSAICVWWGASRAIVLPENNGIWAATWGQDIDHPEYISAFRIRHCEAPRYLFLDEAKYFARSGQPQFEWKMTTEFLVEPVIGGSSLNVIQDGFPEDPLADEFYQACEVGWRNTFQGIRNYLSSKDDTGLEN